MTFTNIIDTGNEIHRPISPLALKLCSMERSRWCVIRNAQFATQLHEFFSETFLLISILDSSLELTGIADAEGRGDDTLYDTVLHGYS